MSNNLLYIIMDTTDFDAGDITGDGGTVTNKYVDKTIQTSKDTVRKSVDGSKVVLKTDPDDYDPMFDFIPDENVLTHRNCVDLMHTAEWSETE